jgi:hypothetical protein
MEVRGKIYDMAKSLKEKVVEVFTKKKEVKKVEVVETKLDPSIPESKQREYR